MKNIKFIILVLTILTLTLAGCVDNNKNQNTEKSIHAYVGAGMQKPMDEIGKKFEEKYGIKVVFDYAGSGYLYSKILATKSGDIFMPGAYYYMDLLEKKGYVLKYSNITKHIPVIVVKKGNPKNIKSLEDLGNEGISLAFGDKNIAIGRTTEKILEKLKKDNPEAVKRIENNIKVRCATVNQVVLYVENGNVDSGICWKSNALQSKDKVDIVKIDPKYNVIKTIPVGILSFTKDKEDATMFYNFVLSDEGKNIFKKYGFEILEN